MAKRKDHVTVSNVAGGHLLTCTHCGATQIVPLPMAVEEWKTITGRFQKRHKGCPPAVEVLAESMSRRTAAGQQADTEGGFPPLLAPND